MARSATAQPDEPGLIPLREAARRLGISQKALYNRAREGQIRHFRFMRPGGARARISFDPRDIAALKQAAEVPAILASQLLNPGNNPGGRKRTKRA